MYGVNSEELYTAKFDRNSDLGRICLGRIDMTGSDQMKAEKKFPISEQGSILGKLLDSTECHILFHISASKAFMSKMPYLEMYVSTSLPNFATKTKKIQVDNEQYVRVLFIIPVIININVGFSFKNEEYIWVRRYNQFRRIMC